MRIGKNAEKKRPVPAVHKPVLKKEVLDCLAPEPNENFIDATAGEGGYIFELIKKNKPEGMVLGIEWDAELYRKLKSRASAASKAEPKIQIPKRLILTNDSYVHLKKIVEKHNFKPVNGLLLDLGMSSWHLEESGRGFSFLKNEPLDMRYDFKNQKFPTESRIRDDKIIGTKIKNQNDADFIEHFQQSRNKSKFKNDLTAERIVNQYSREEIERILREYGEERFAKGISKEIVKARKIKPIKTTFDLVKIIKRAIPRRYLHQKIHPATRTFQALRIAVNDELDNLKKVLPQAAGILAAGGKIAIISFHSLEDGIVKNFFKNNSSLKTLTKKPIRPGREEIKINPRSRSAKLRAAQKI